MSIKKVFANLAILTIAAIALTTVVAILMPNLSAIKKMSGFFTAQQSITSLVKQLDEKVNLPPPLRVSFDAAFGTLTINGTFDATNSARQKAGVPALTQNNELNEAAAAKLADMFAYQYFAHVSPAGIEPADWVDQAGYHYIATGENLALGGFADDAALVDAWMASPGHRENILDASYEEIGIAVGRGEFEGRTTWLAVQVFGKPKSSCPEVDLALKASIDAGRTQLDAWTPQLETLKNQLAATRPKKTADQQAIDEYNQLVARYNALAENFNVLAQRIEQSVDSYNAQVQQYNTCANN